MKSAKVISQVDDVQPFSMSNLSSLSANNVVEPTVTGNDSTSLILSQLESMSKEIADIKAGNTRLSEEKLNAQIVEALTSLNNHSKQLDRMVDGFEQKLISFALKIASRVIDKEIEENSSKIAHGFANELIDKLKDATKISVHVNPKDYEYLNSHLDLSETIELIKDANVQPSGIVVSSDIGNLDSTIESKLDVLAQSIETLY